MSVAVLAITGAAVAGATVSFFTDTEVSENNVFTAGAIDLKVDSQAHYNGAMCVDNTDNNVVDYVWVLEADTVLADYAGFPVLGEACDNSWEEADLGAEQFFSYTDVKPGDFGENTISLHVYDNDAWGRFVVEVLEDTENTCTEPELGDESTCEDDDDGELREAMLFSAWLDEGTTPGFQGSDVDSEEGDNILNGVEEEFWTGEMADENSWDFAHVLGDTTIGSYQLNDCGNANSGCEGIVADGRMVGGITYYFGLAWELPGTTDNSVQTDGMSATMKFEVEQRRNNDIPSWTPSS